MTKPTFLFLNISGDFESIAMRVKEEGYPIYFYKRKGMIKGREDTGVGIFEKEEMIEDKYEVLNKFVKNKEDLYIIYDDNGYGDEADYLRHEGWKVIGSCAYADKLEYERGLGTKLMKAIGLTVPDEHVFTSIDDALQFMEKEDDEARYVFKVDGEDFAGSSKTYTGKNKQDLIGYMTWIKADCVTQHYTIDKFLLQEFVPGYEADFSAYFDGEKFMQNSISLDIEEKKSADGNKGEATGCMGNVVAYFEKSRYFDEYISKLTPLLQKAGFVGQISINNIFSNGENKKYAEGQPFGLEFTPRCGWDAHLTEVALMKNEGLRIADFYMSLADKKDFDFPTRVAGCGVRVYTGAVTMKKEEVSGRFFSFDPSIEQNLWFYSVAKKEGGYTIEDNPILVVNTTNKDLQKAIDECYDKLKLLNIPDIYYRMEIGKRAKDVMLFLRGHDWI